MSHECCRHHETLVESGRAAPLESSHPGPVDRDRRAAVEPSRLCAPIQPEETVAEVVRHRAGAIRILQEMGINHCCGAHLTLREAAASAGVPLDDVVAALRELPAATPGSDVLDVRGLEPPQPLVRVLQAIERLGPGGELEVRHDRRPIFLYPQLDERGFVHETDEPEPGLVRIRIRRRAA